MIDNSSEQDRQCIKEMATEGVAEVAEGAEAIGASEVLHAAADAVKEEDK